MMENYRIGKNRKKGDLGEGKGNFFYLDKVQILLEKVYCT